MVPSIYIPSVFHVCAWHRCWSGKAFVVVPSLLCIAALTSPPIVLDPPALSSRQKRTFFVCVHPPTNKDGGCKTEATHTQPMSLS